jgi:hypothetical protein
MNMRSLRPHGWVALQAHQSAASRMLALAAHLGERDPQEWAARVLAFAQARSSGSSADQVLRVAQAVALARGQAPDTQALHALWSTGEPALWRDDAQARADFNRPPHWSVGADGRFQPDAARLRGAAAQAWSSLTHKFGADLAQRLFDANVRGGAMAVFAAMDAVGSALPVTVSDVARLQFAALTDGTPRLPGAGVPSIPTLHDAGHSMSAYGVSVQQEIHGDLFSEGLLDTLFGDDASVVIDRGRALTQQPQATGSLRQAIADQFDKLSLNLMLAELDTAFQTRLVGRQQIARDWEGTPYESAVRAEQILEANGLLAHLSAQGLQAVRALIYGPHGPTFECLAADFVHSGERQAFVRDANAWLDDMAGTLRDASPDALMTREQFTRHAAQAVAFGLLIERTAPGSLRMGLLDVPVNEDDLMPAARTLDLRSAYPSVLREVQRALGMAP